MQELQTPDSGLRARVAALDGLRAVSVLAVILGHGALTVPEGLAVWRRVLGAYPSAELGVHVFFVISGYLITTLLIRELDAHGRIDLGAFYLRRIRRIFPVFYSYLLALVVLGAAGVVAVSTTHLVSAASFLWNYKNLWDTAPGAGNWFLGHFWTLALEEQFYLVWPPVLALAGLAGARRTALIAIALLPAVRVATYFAVPAMRPQLGMMFHTAIDTIMVGCLLALSERTARRLEHPALVALAFAVLVGLDPALERHFRGTYRFTLGITVRAAAIAVLVQWAARRPESGLARLLAWRPLVHVGVLSYSLYVWQQLALARESPGWCGGFPGNLVACFALAEASYWLIERTTYRGQRTAPERSSPASSTGSGTDPTPR